MECVKGKHGLLWRMNHPLCWTGKRVWGKPHLIQDAVPNVSPRSQFSVWIGSVCVQYVNIVKLTQRHHISAPCSWNGGKTNRFLPNLFFIEYLETQWSFSLLFVPFDLRSYQEIEIRSSDHSLWAPVGLDFLLFPDFCFRICVVNQGWRFAGFVNYNNPYRGKKAFPWV